MTIKIILGEHQITRTELLGGIVIVSGCGAVAYCISKFWGYGAIAPYPQSGGNRVTRALQRAVIDKTKTPIKTHFYPLDSLRTVTPRRASDNGHAVSGAVRDAARRLINESIETVGGSKFELNPNPNSTMGPRNHFHFAVGDLAQNFRDDQPAADAFIVGVDVDYYITEPDVLLEHMRPLVLHTFNPKKVSGFDADSPFTINNNLVEYKVSGGAAWVHPVWDWCEAGEFIASRVRSSWFEWLLQLPLRCLGLERVGYHKIHHCRPWTDCPDRALVYTIPQHTVWRFTWIDTEIHTRKLKRITYQDNTKPGWNRLEHVSDNNQLLVSIGREGEHMQITIEKDKLEMLSGLGATQSVNARLIGMGHKDPLYTSMIVQYYTGKKVVLSVAPTVYRPTMPRVHWPVTSDADVPEVSARQYTKPIISDCMMMPMIKRWETMSESIERRVTFVANNKKPSDAVAKIAAEFVSLMNGPFIDLEPLTIEETVERLNKPSQQLQLRAVFEIMGVEPRQVIESFNKNEPGMKSSRIISAFPDILFIVKVSRYTLAYSDAVLHAEHNQHWYYPGRTPVGITDGVCEFVSDCDGQVIETDFSNLDGRVSGWMQRNIAQKAMVQAFRAEYRDEIISFMDTIINCPAKAKRFGFRYEPGMGVKSGSPTTTPHNTQYNACVEYTALKFEYPDANPEDLFSLLGPKCGDDGLARATIQKTINRAAKCYGLELKVEKYNPEVGLCFLSRVFVDPLNTPTTIQDPLRTLRKLHITTRDPTIPIADAACDRVEGYLCTDAHTPLISEYCRMVQRLYGPKTSTRDVREARRSRNKEKPYWLTCDGSWPQHPQDALLMKQIVVSRTGIDEDTVDKLIGRFAAMKDVWEPITLESEESKAAQTIDEEGVAPGSVDESLLKLNDAKQTRSNSGTSGPHTKGGGSGTGNELPRSTKQRAKGPRQSAGLPKQGKANSKPNGNVAAGQAQHGGIPRGKTPSGGKTNARRAPPKAGAQPGAPTNPK
ncbi:protein A [Boolarra virus]|uniref:RNA-directed RNA polymerase n=1 Tax=Boolarra virus TaxID=12286 RepID=RDRP_BOOLV|nr:protein A [Boolarra virus]Q992J0.1 RecName: Full=RNA-directed RNA polymerase; Short=RdRp; AltName: Full=RNA replicase; Short=Protein A [Boolarra virus]AAK15751.1 protein A [Boolarra virus]